MYSEGRVERYRCRKCDDLVSTTFLVRFGGMCRRCCEVETSVAESGVDGLRREGRHDADPRMDTDEMEWTDPLDR